MFVSKFSCIIAMIVEREKGEIWEFEEMRGRLESLEKQSVGFEKFSEMLRVLF